LAAVRVNADERGFGGSWGFIDRQGRWAIRPVYGDVYSFSDGFSRVCLGGDRCGFIYRQGEILSTPTPDHIWIKPQMGQLAQICQSNQWLACQNFDC